MMYKNKNWLKKGLFLVFSVFLMSVSVEAMAAIKATANMTFNRVPSKGVTVQLVNALFGNAAGPVKTYSQSFSTSFTFSANSLKLKMNVTEYGKAGFSCMTSQTVNPISSTTNAVYNFSVNLDQRTCSYTMTVKPY